MTITQMRNWTYCDKIARDNLPLPCHVRIAAKPAKNCQGSFYENFNNVSKHAENSQYFKNGIYSVGIRYAKEFAAADTIVIAAPYWDLAFPALLKIYLEQITVYGITFRYKKGIPQGLCRAKRLIYVTTAGGTIYDNYGLEYVKALAQKLYGIGEVLFFKAENLDIDGNDAIELIDKANNRINTGSLE